MRGGVWPGLANPDVDYEIQESINGVAAHAESAFKFTVQEPDKSTTTAAPSSSREAWWPGAGGGRRGGKESQSVGQGTSRCLSTTTPTLSLEGWSWGRCGKPERRRASMSATEKLMQQTKAGRQKKHKATAAKGGKGKAGAMVGTAGSGAGEGAGVRFKLSLASINRGVRIGHLKMMGAA